MRQTGEEALSVLGLLLETGRAEEQPGVAVPGNRSGTAGRGLTVR